MDTSPSPAERARTILARPVTMFVCGADGAQDRDARALVLRPDPPATHSTTPSATHTATRRVSVEIADAAPLPVRERIRGRVRAVGSMVEDPGDATFLLHAHTLTLVEDEASKEVDVTSVLAAEPDPLMMVEAAMLGHLDLQHGQILPALVALVDPRHLRGDVRVWPYRLDRYGLVLRMEHPAGHVDQRLGFRRALTSADHLVHEMALLFARARNQPAEPRTEPVPPPREVEQVIRASGSASRLCSPQQDDESPGGSCC